MSQLLTEENYVWFHEDKIYLSSKNVRRLFATNNFYQYIHFDTIYIIFQMYNAVSPSIILH